MSRDAQQHYWPKCSIIVPVFNEAQHIVSFLDRVEGFAYPGDQLEIIVVDGMSTDGTLELLEDWARESTLQAVVLQNENRTVPHALNMAVRHSCGEVVVRLDAHTLYPASYIAQCVRLSLTTGADNVGGVVTPEVLGSSRKAEAIRHLSMSVLGVGNSRFRVAGAPAGPAETVPFGCFTRDCFAKFGLFNEYLTRAQDLEYNKRIRKLGGEVVMDPAIVSIYYNRGSIWKLAVKNFNSGRWTWVFPYVSIVRPSLRHTLPMLFVLCGLAAVLGAAAGIVPWGVVLILSGIYAAVLAIGAALKDGIRAAAVLWWFVCGCIVSHVSYGLGSWVGLCVTGPRCHLKKRSTGSLVEPGLK